MSVILFLYTFYTFSRCKIELLRKIVILFQCEYLNEYIGKNSVGVHKAIVFFPFWVA